MMTSSKPTPTTVPVPRPAVFTGVPVVSVLQDKSERAPVSTLLTLVVPHHNHHHDNDDDDIDDNDTRSFVSNQNNATKMHQLRLYARMFGMTMGFFTVAATMAPQLPLLLYTASHYPTTMSMMGTTTTTATTATTTMAATGGIIGVLNSVQIRVAIWLGLWCMLVCTMFYVALCLVSVMIKTANTDNNRRRRLRGDAHDSLIHHHRRRHDDDDNNAWMMMVEREGMTWCMFGIICCYTIMDVFILPRSRTYLIFVGGVYLVIGLVIFVFRRCCDMTITHEEHQKKDDDDNDDDDDDDDECNDV